MALITDDRQQDGPDRHYISDGKPETGDGKPQDGDETAHVAVGLCRN